MKEFFNEVFMEEVGITGLFFISVVLIVALFMSVVFYNIGYANCKIETTESIKKYNMCISLCEIDHPKYSIEQCDYICEGD